MTTFFKTFFVCMVIAIGFFVYNFLMHESYSPELNVSNDNMVFSNKDKFRIEENFEEGSQLPIEKDFDKKQQVSTDNKYEYICYFYTQDGKLTPVTRSFSVKQTLQNNIAMLLRGPTIAELKSGIYSEIPKNVDIISVKESDDSVIVNLTAGFGQGGGSQSIESRVKQLSATVKKRLPKKKVYLYIDNQEVEYLGGEGIYIKQPLE